MESAAANVEPQLWPSLKEAHGQQEENEETEHQQEQQSLDDSWELLNEEQPETSTTQKNDNPRIGLLRRNSFSSPELRNLTVHKEHEDGDTEAVVLSPEDASTISSFSMVSSKNPKIVHRFPSFLDAVKQTTKVPLVEDEETMNDNKNQINKIPRTRVKPKFEVVKPLKRCSKSTGDLRSLNETEILGDTDAMEYYHRKAKGSVGRMNGLKERPDEARRKEMILYKKNMQRKAAQQKR